MDNNTRLLERFNFEIPGGRWHLFEVCDLWIVPTFVKHCCQNTLTAQWTRRLPFIQDHTPAEIAARLILDALDGIDDTDSGDWTLIDFCSGSGGPTAVIEQLVNHARAKNGQKPIPFRLSDKNPYLDAWIELAAQSKNLSFIPQPVDAGNPPFAVISSTTPGNKDVAFDQGYESNGNKVFRLYCQSFHLFDDDVARNVLKSTLGTSDAFAIIELQDRRIGSIFMTLIESSLLLLVSIFWFWHDKIHLLWTYAIPFIPLVYIFDGLVSCIRTRTFEETMELIDDFRHKLSEQESDTLNGKCGDWQFGYSRVVHTWPVGHMNVITGKKKYE